MRDNDWGADVPISKPVPPPREQPVHVDMGGIGFTSGGLAHYLSEADAEEWFLPTYAPPGTP